MAIRSFVNNEKTLIRFVAFLPIDVYGYYRYGNTLQIFSLPDETPEPRYLLGFRPIIIEYAYNTITSEKITEIRGNHSDSSAILDESLYSEYNSNKQDEILSILSVATKYVFNFDVNRIPVEEHAKYFWEVLSEYGNTFTAIDIEPIPLSKHNKYHNELGSLADSFSLCECTQHLLDKYFSLDKEKKDAFLSASVLFTQSSRCWKISHSIAYVGFVSSLEALIEYDYKDKPNEICPECKKTIYEVRQKFLAFTKKYAGGNENNPLFRKYVDRLYGRRSAIGHRGQLLSNDLAGDFLGWEIEMTDSHELMNLQNTVRICFVNWLLAS